MTVKKLNNKRARSYNLLKQELEDKTEHTVRRSFLEESISERMLYFNARSLLDYK
jgi:hypothetical protein